MNRFSIQLLAFYLFFVVLNFANREVFAQNFAVQAIQFEGIKRTDLGFLGQFVQTEENAPFILEEAQADRQRLVNLEMLSDVQLRIDTVEHGVNVIFECDESRTFLPIVGFGGIRENLWLHLGFAEINLKGRGIKLSAFYQFYDRHSININLRVPNINGSKWGLQANITRWATIEPLYFPEGSVDYNYNNNAYELNAFYDFTFQDQIQFGGGFFNEQYEKRLDPFNTEPTPGPALANKDKILNRFVYRKNKLNYHFYFIDGFVNQFNVETVTTLGENDPFFWLVVNNFLYFKRVGKKGNWANRLAVGLAQNNESPFAPFVLDSYLNIRGIGNRIDRGTGKIVWNTEFRYSIYDKKKYAIQTVAFADTGTWRLAGRPIYDFLRSGNMRTFAGLGTRFIYKKIFNAIFRVDYGVDVFDPKTGGFVLGIGQYF